MKVLIVDDEALARSRLKRLLAIYPDLSSHREASNGTQALELMQSWVADLVFLDVDMPGLNGLEVANELNLLAVPPAIVFVTAHPEHALEALQLSAAGYLVKPVTEQNLAKTLEQIGRVTRAHMQKKKTATISYQLAGVSRVIALEKVYYIISEEKYTRIIFDDGEAIIDQSLKQLVSDFPVELLQIHRKILINRSQLHALKKAEDGSHVVELKNCTHLLPVSRRAYKVVKEQL
ncbi:response regulator transcription factor [Pseudoalteromonas sp. NEC-BIFX-2020_002]|uniref:LytR/AlgR family response regulator transcription factor n=1 Tax=Pseudoalteromonas sp. NEC-BIFX-2020_002 TaxID=2732353 RepID=UPI001476AE52|nr:LytTR family DNA-binding domain-containing protein [Pseudoalteromonas sp. NEC-BIFX-2020_002]NNG43885.1 response regulator transcription factor [Pseudoalteromonas sp. NEC-BIFX-2020_002]